MSTHHHDAENTGVLPGLPGSDSAPGSGPAVRELFDRLVDDEAGLGAGSVPAAAQAHERHASAWYADLVGPLLVPAGSQHALAAELERRAGGGRRPLAVSVVAAGGAADPLTDAADTATALDARDDVHVVSLTVPLPREGDQGAAAAVVAGRLALATPRPDVRVWVEVHRTPGWLDAMRVLARAGDGAGVALRAGGGTIAALPSPEDLAAMLRSCVDVEVALTLVGGVHRVVRGPDPASGVVQHGLLNVVGALRAALNGAEVPEVADVLASTDTAALASGARRLSEADAAVLRAFWHSAGCDPVTDPISELASLGLVDAEHPTTR